MTDGELDRLNDEAIGRESDRRLETSQIDGETCKICGGRGTVLGSDTEEAYGISCPNNCKLDRSAFLKRDDLKVVDGRGL